MATESYCDFSAVAFIIVGGLNPVSAGALTGFLGSFMDKYLIRIEETFEV